MALSILAEVRDDMRYNVAAWRLYRKYHRDALKRELVFQIDFWSFCTLIFADCHYCGLSYKSGKTIKHGAATIRYNGIDRKDSAAGYTEENILFTCCHGCNMAKKDRDYADFIIWLDRIASYRKVA